MNDQFQKVYWQTAKFRNPYKGKLVERNTRLFRRSDECIVLRLYSTDIITWYPTHMVINTGGWNTKTTKSRINQFLDGYYLFQKKHELYLECVEIGSTIKFEDRIVIKPLPSVVAKIMQIAKGYRND